MKKGTTLTVEHIREAIRIMSLPQEQPLLFGIYFDLMQDIQFRHVLTEYYGLVAFIKPKTRLL